MIIKRRTTKRKGHGFGTAPVFLTSICSILGAIMFLRFGYAVGHLGLIGALAVILLGHLIVIPTGLAISEIATNLKVGGGGEYYIISRSFGARIGSTVGILLYSSQVISIAFYIIAFAQTFSGSWFQPYIEHFEKFTDLAYDPRMISIPLILLLFFIILKKGAKLGIGFLWIIFVLLVGAIGVFLLGSPSSVAETMGNSSLNSSLNSSVSSVINNVGKTGLSEHISNPDSFVMVFSIVFPAFTGMTAGVGLSGDLKNPSKSIPKGVLLATVTGLLVYICIVIKLYYNASAADLASNQLIMSSIALWGPLVLIGLVAATLSSAVGFTLIAPRTLQALGSDKIFPNKKVNSVVAKGFGPMNEPRAATVLSAAIVIVFILVGELNIVAQIITMFFLITYGSICLISFIEHFAGNPSYRPTFKTKWYLSLIGLILCLGMMFQIHPLYAFISIILLGSIYMLVGLTHKESRSFSIMFQGAMFQLSRRMKISLQRSGSKPDKFNWRPSVVAISSHAQDRAAPKNLLRWLAHHYGFGTLIHYIKGKLNEKTRIVSKRSQNELIEQMKITGSNYSVMTIVSPSFTTAVAQAVQFSGISGLDNNTMLFEFHKNRMNELPDIVLGCELADVMQFNLCVLRSSEHNFGPRKKIHIWLRMEDYVDRMNNANLMILISFIIIAHRDWKDSDITIHTAIPKADEDKPMSQIIKLISKGRFPIAVKNIKSFTYADKKRLENLIHYHSGSADLVILGFDKKELGAEGIDLFKRYPDLPETLFICANEKIYIS